MRMVEFSGAETAAASTHWGPASCRNARDSGDTELAARSVCGGHRFFAPRYGNGETLAEEIVDQMQLVYYRDGASATISVDRTGEDLFLSFERENGRFRLSRVTRPIKCCWGIFRCLLHPRAPGCFRAWPPERE